MPAQLYHHRERRSILTMVLCICGALLLGVPLGRSAAQSGDLPSITTQPKTQQVLASQRVTLSVIADGTPPLSYQWYVGHNGDTSAPLLHATNSTFTSEPLFSPYRFWVRISNPFGSVDSGTAFVDIEPEVPGIYTTRLPIIWRAGPALPFLRADDGR